MPGQPAEKLLTVEEFLSFEGEPEVHYELVDGQIIAMAPALLSHGAIAVNLGVALTPRLTPPGIPGTPWRPGLLPSL